MYVCLHAFKQNDDALIHIKHIEQITRITDQSNRQREAKNEKRSRFLLIMVDVVSHIGVVGEADFKIKFNSEFPNRIGLFFANFDNPIGSEFHSHVAKVFL